MEGDEEMENADANSKYQDKAKELHKADVDRLFIKITESRGLRVNVGVFNQRTE